MGYLVLGILYVLKSSNALRIWNFQTRLFTFEEIGFELGSSALELDQT